MLISRRQLFRKHCSFKWLSCFSQITRHHRQISKHLYIVVYKTRHVPWRTIMQTSCYKLVYQRLIILKTWICCCCVQIFECWLLNNIFKPLNRHIVEIKVKFWKSCCYENGTRVRVKVVAVDYRFARHFRMNILLLFAFTAEITHFYLN